MIKTANGQLKVLAVVPARQGSKGIVRKNARMLAGIPLLAYSVLGAKKSRYIDRVVVSTDDPGMQKLAIEFGGEAPFLRPKELAGDLVPDFPVVDHCVRFLKEHDGFDPDIILYMWPTGALRSIKDIDQGIELLAENPDADSVRSVNLVSKSPYKMWTLGQKFMQPLLSLGGVKDAHHAPRQSLPPVYQSNPYVLVFWKRTLEQQSLLGKKVLPLVISGPVVDIDTEMDWAAAEWLLRQKPGS